MIPIYTQATAAMRVHLGDTEVAAGQVWTDASGKCDTYIQQAYSEIFKGFESGGVKNIERTLYGNVPAYTSYIKPATFGAVNFSEPADRPLFERDSAGSVAITGAAPNVVTPGQSFCRITTGTAHGFTDGQMVLIFGIVGLTDDVNDQWSVVVQSPTSFDLMGCTATGTWSSGGTATGSTQDWSELDPMVEMSQYPQTPSGTLNRYAWVGNAFRVLPASTIRQVKMLFYLSGQAPTTATPAASFGIDDCLGFIAYRASALAVLDRVGANGKFQSLNRIALGPTEQHSDWGGLYGQLMRSKVRSAARVPIVIGSFRNARRNTGWTQRY